MTIKDQFYINLFFIFYLIKQIQLIFIKKLGYSKKESI